MQDTKLASTFNRLKRQLLSRVWLSRLILGLSLILVILFFYFISRPLIGPLAVFISPLASQLDHSANRTNFVILGVGGPGHEAPDLTDTIIFASLQLATGQITLISIPRDLWVPSMRAKINTAYHYGEQRRPDSGGLTLAKSSVSEVLNQPVHYAAVINFNSFVEFIDHLGGIEVVVQRAFVDAFYPLPDRENDDCGGDPQTLCRYETVTFSAGPQYMDGNLALKFVRSRHADDDEGTDFARSRRQTQAIQAILSKLTAIAKHPRNFSLLKQGYDIAMSGLETDFPKNNLPLLLRLGLLVRHQALATAALAESNTLYHPPVSSEFDSQWVLIPQDRNPQVVYDFVADLLK